MKTGRVSSFIFVKAEKHANGRESDHEMPVIPKVNRKKKELRDFLETEYKTAHSLSDPIQHPSTLLLHATALPSVHTVCRDHVLGAGLGVCVCVGAAIQQDRCDILGNLIADRAAVW